MDSLPDRPLTWQEVTLAFGVSIILPGAGLFLAGLALLVTIREGQVIESIALALAAIWSIVFFIVLLSYV